MTEILKVPELGENVDAVDVTAVLVSVGDAVAVDQPVIEVETDKAAVEVPSTLSGTVTEVHVATGDSLGPGAPIVTIDGTTAEPAAEDSTVLEQQAAAHTDEAPKAPTPTEAVTTQPVTMTVPDLGEGIDAVEVTAVFVAAGDTIETDQSVIEVETEKASVEVPATVPGVVLEVHAHTGDSLAEGAPIVTVEARSGEATAPAPAAPARTPSAAEPKPAVITASEQTPPAAEAARPPRDVAPHASRASVPAAPTVRRFAREVGVDITQVAGSGPGGRISIDDVKAYTNRLLQQAASSPIGAAAPELPDFSAWGSIRREPMSRIRQVTAKNMARAWVTVPHVTNHDVADITRLEELRKIFKTRVEAAGGKLTVTAILVKVAASALKVFPKVNASLDTAEQEIVFKEYVHVGVAVDTERGLLVPVIRNADTKNVTEIAVELDDLARRARERKLKPDEMQGASFTITNLGGIGGTSFTPIVNWPEVAILGVSRGSLEPRWIDNGWVPRLMLPLSLSYDHRLVDGADAARFLRWVAEAVEQPLLLALEG